MGSLKRLRIPAEEVLRLYKAGESAGMISLRAKVPLYMITALIEAAGIRLRGAAEGARAAHAARRRRAIVG